MSTPSFAELRFYSVEPGRMHDMGARFHGPLQRLFERHGISVVGGWQSSYGARSPLFVYLMHWPSLEVRNHAWNGFYGDPDWYQVRTETNRGSELVERYDINFLRPIVPLGSDELNEFEEIELYVTRLRVGTSRLASQWIEGTAPAQLARSGGRLLGAYEYLTGDDLPRAALFLGWKGAQDRNGALSTMEVDPLGRADRYLLHHI
ncbi:NIPSNAP family protein [Paraburkholderia phymatum]|uniref:NIPSNAP family protein n=1 Tax=Paraburkholderia phymatum TaxID=148447 RepID=UPI0031764A0E